MSSRDWGSLCFVHIQNFAAQMAGGFDEKSGGAQMGVMQGPMVWLTVLSVIFIYLCSIIFSNIWKALTKKDNNHWDLELSCKLSSKLCVFFWK